MFLNPKISPLTTPSWTSSEKKKQYLMTNIKISSEKKEQDDEEGREK